MIKKALLGCVAILLGAFAWLVIAPPDLIRVGANYTAKMICSNVVLAGRDPAQVLEIDVQAPGHPLLKLMQFSIDERNGTTVVRTGLFGFIGKGLAFGDRKRGCTTVPDPRLLGIAAAKPSFVAPDVTYEDALWPVGNTVELAENPELDAVLNDDALTGQGMRAIVIVKNGRIIAERYGPGFDAQTPLLGWSMAKTVTASLVGIASKADILSLSDPMPFDGWADDDRRAIRLSDLMGMAGDLQWNEGYGSVSDVTRMLFLEEDMAAFVASSPIDIESPEPTGDIFEYSSGTTILISNYLHRALGEQSDAVAFPSKTLFEPLGMASAVLETDAAGTLAGSSYMYATGRDWARFGQFMLQRGVWNGRSILPIGYADWMVELHPASNGDYGRGQIWRTPPREHEVQVSQLPAGTFWAGGHDGQSIAMVPEEDLVVVRLGLTPSKLDFKPGLLTQAIIRALQ